MNSSDDDDENKRNNWHNFHVHFMIVEFRSGLWMRNGWNGIMAQLTSLLFLQIISSSFDLIYSAESAFCCVSLKHETQFKAKSTVIKNDKERKFFRMWTAEEEKLREKVFLVRALRSLRYLPYFIFFVHATLGLKLLLFSFNEHQIKYCFELVSAVKMFNETFKVCKNR
jgi:hypothetical protein